MAGSREGGLEAAETNKRLYGEDWYARIGKIGGMKSRTGGFAAPGGRERARIAGAIGGAKSRRRGKVHA